jgi:hypothetical protein
VQADEVHRLRVLQDEVHQVSCKGYFRGAELPGEGFLCLPNRDGARQRRGMGYWLDGVRADGALGYSPEIQRLPQILRRH